jgi:RimJ/RimL family protein N-acetyltransferase
MARAADAALSYPAVISAQERLWEQYGGPWGWPAATLTLAEERAYLEDDERRAREREGFAYAVFTKGEHEIVGYVYVERPMLGHADDADALMSWWLVDGYAGRPLESCIAELVPRWLGEEWLRRRPRWGIATDAGSD